MSGVKWGKGPMEEVGDGRYMLEVVDYGLGGDVYWEVTLKDDPEETVAEGMAATRKLAVHLAFQEMVLKDIELLLNDPSW